MLTAIVESSEDAIIGMTPQGTIQSWNAGAQRIYGYSPGQVLGKPVSILVPPDLLGEVPRMLDQVGQGTRIDHFETQQVRRDGQTIHVCLTVSAIRDVNSKIVGALLVARDITDRRQMEESIRKNVHELDVRIKELNCLFSISRLLESPDLSTEEILRATVDLIAPAWQYPEATGARIVVKGHAFETSNFRETNWRLAKEIIVRGEPVGSLEVCYLEEKPGTDIGPFLKEEKSLISAIGERLGRIIEHKWAEDALLLSERRFRNLVHNCLMGISIIQDNKVVYQNPEQERLLGPLPRKALLTDQEGIHPEDAQKVTQFYQGIQQGKALPLDVDFRFYKTDEAKATRVLKWVYCRVCQTEYQGKEAVLINIMDMTEAKQLENLLRIQDKMTSLGRVAAGIAHEIRNPLSGINIYLKALQNIYGEPDSQEKVRGIFERLESASDRIESVIRRVMDFSKPGMPKFVLADINQSIEEAVQLASVTLRKSGVHITKGLSPQLPPCRVDSRLIEQVILNLITNSIEAMRDVGGIKRLEVGSSVEGDHLVLTVSDSGPGISEGSRERIFDPFYSTKSGSTGLGLSICKRIVTDHGGSLSVSTSPWGGAEFVITLPLEKASGS